eukprot:Colp12_sorted_trinity150504_noHs@10650
MASRRRSLFRPCIDLHNGQVKQIVGGTLSDNNEGLKTNFVASESAGYFSKLYADDGLRGGHVIKLGPGNDEAALEAVKAYPKGLHIGGGITADNAKYWLDAGAEKVIVTSWLFVNDQLNMDRLKEISQKVGPEQLVLDLSCRRRNDSWFVAINRWQTVTETEVNEGTLRTLAQYCSEFLVHAADVEGLCMGIDQLLVQKLAEWSPIDVTYAGGAKDISDLELVDRLSNGRVDLTYGSALDIFGGTKVKYSACVEWNKQPTH